MLIMRRRIAPAVLAGTLLVSGLTGCSLFGGNVSQEDVEDLISEEIGNAGGTEPEEVRCKGDLEGEEGAKQTCAVKAEDDQWLEFDIVATSVDGDTVEFDVDGEQTPLDGEPDY